MIDILAGAAVVAAVTAAVCVLYLLLTYGLPIVWNALCAVCEWLRATVRTLRTPTVRVRRSVRRSVRHDDEEYDERYYNV